MLGDWLGGHTFSVRFYAVETFSFASQVVKPKSLWCRSQHFTDFGQTSAWSNKLRNKYSSSVK